MRVFVAGATGVIGRSLVALLIDAGHDVTGMTRSPGRAKRLQELKTALAPTNLLRREGTKNLLAAARAAGVSRILAETEQRAASNAKAKVELGWQPSYASWRDGFRTAGG
jgi:nucleoside-diphosphate-sugar epimerase